MVVSVAGYRVARMDDEARRIYLLGMIAVHSRGAVTDQDGLGKEHKARAQTFIDAGAGLELFSQDEGQRLSDALGEGVTDSLALRELLD